jgi:hypothetical protein
MLKHRGLAGVGRIVTHPAFWLPIMLVVINSVYLDGLSLDLNKIISDGWGYYLPLPAIFVYGDPHLTFLNRPDLASDVMQPFIINGRWLGLYADGAGYIDKYAIGPAVLQLPFFLVALLIAHFQYASINGFETTFHIANAASGAFYFGLGSFLIFRTCRLRFEALPSALALVAVTLGTNILQYACIEPGFSHVYGYCLVAGLMYLTVSRAEAAEAASLPAFVLFGILMGLAVMTRPTNAIYSLLFIVFARRTPMRELLIGGACAFLASLVAASPQLIWWYVTTGKLIFYSYGSEGFRFGSPELRNYMISVRKGMFFWHPFYLLMVLALLGSVLRRPLEGAVSALIVALAIYLGASWSDYSFGHSFGSRNSIELLPLLAVPFAGAISFALNKGWRWPASAVFVLLIAINLVQYRGYIKSTIPHNNTTPGDYAKFWSLTLRMPAIERLVLPAQ